ncbi:interferon-induced very large GTPase 1-like [Gigaspora margarita]|uniref:Interferon-induced very large GTPase 1-like n=1 Tax=Gigaspora margarita TaxID=4874 RepID=A0A8H3WZG9_GIGMA|nr:interferon-induced very large GTPase 1-like [Gigaspora margarita]
MNCQSSPALTVDDFFKLSFGLTPIELDPTEFVTNEFTKELFVSLIEPSLKVQNPTGIFRNLFPYIVDIISRTIPIVRLVNYVQEINENNDFDDIYQNFQRFEEFCTSRDFLIAFLDKVPTNSFSKILNTLVAANIPIPIYLSNDTHSQKGLKVLNELHDIIVARKYHLFISVNQATTDYLETPFTKQLYKTYSNNREDCSSICNPNSIDISFHDASENLSRPPLAISEIYYDESSSSIFSDTVKLLTKFAFYIVIHISNNDFDGNELNDQFISTINDISIECFCGHKRKILILFWGIKPQHLGKHKEKVEKLLRKKFTNDEFWIEPVNNKKNALFERIKKDSFHKLTNTENPWLDWKSINFSKILGNNVENFLSENDFALSIAELEKFNRRADILHASYCENEIETLKDKKHLKTAEDSQNYKAEGEINRDILKFQNTQKNIGKTGPISVLTHFANVIKTNDIKYMREFARQADVYFKDHLNSLAQKNDEIKNNTVESDQSNIQRKEIKQQIEDLDITIHDFWREFVILSKIMRSDGSSVLKKLYDIDDKQLEKAYSVWILEGEAIQILEGVSLRTLNHEFLSSVLSQIMSNFKRQLVVLSVIGLENSGKSTLLNYLFQCGFSTSAGRCTKGAYMSYRHTFYNEKELDVLIIDSEGMGSTAAKYISRRTDFDKKMTLLGLMCSQILIVNTKGLTRDITDILEVSSYHLDALSNRDSNKPRICFVLRDMKDAKIAQQQTFDDIRDSLRKTFKEIPGCYDMDDFMIVEKQDVHLLENAFACSFDDFYPQSMITDSENFHYPAETFPIKISKLRKELLNAALITSENHESQIFKNVYGFITHMQAIWKEIDVRGNFLHFKDSKTIQQWSAMKKLVHGYGETTIKSYKENTLNLIREQTSKGQWNEDNDEAFENDLTQKTELLCTKIIADFKEKISNQYEPQIIDEGETYIKAAFAAEKRELKTTYAKKQRQSKESWLIKSSTMRIGETIGKIFREHKDKTLEEFGNIFSESKLEELFNEEWEKVEIDKENFMRTMIMEEKMLEQHVVASFNQAIVNGRAINNNNTNEKNSKERLKFNRIFWNKISTPATLNQLEFLNDIDMQLINTIKITEQTYLNFNKNDIEKNDFKNTVINRIKTKIKDTCEPICDDLLSRNALAIEFNQALEWLEALCNDIFIVQDEVNNFQDKFKVKIEDFSPAEQYLRFKVFIAIKDNTAKWKVSQQNNLKELRENLLKCFNDILSNSTYENISSHFFKYVDKSVEKQLVIQEQYISEILEMHLKQNWMSEERNPTRYAYEQSFGEYDVEKTRKYIDNPTSFMKELFENDIDIIKDIKVKERLKK